MTAPLWLPGATRVPGRYPGRMDGTYGTKKVVLHTEGVDRGPDGRYGDAAAVARYVADRNIGYHLCYDYSGRWVQLYPADVGARALRAGAWSPNRQGVLAIQVCLVGVVDAADVAKWPMDNWGKFLRWLDDLGVPRESHVDWADPVRSTRLWRKSGWTSHAHSPHNDHVDGRGAPIGLLLGRREPADEPEHPNRRIRVTGWAKTGRRKFVRRRRDGTFTFRNKGRVKLNRREARAAMVWARGRGADPKRTTRPGRAFLDLAPGAAWPTDGRLLRKLNRVARRRRRIIRIVSGRRTYRQQLALWNAWLRHRDFGGPPANLAAYPNANAPHIRGVAADCGVVDAKGRYRSLGLDAKAARLARDAGLAAWVPGEPWHWQRRETY